jgi:hypothetical protein
MPFSLQANYTDRGAAIGRQSYCQLLRVEGCRMASTMGPDGHLSQVL